MANKKDDLMEEKKTPSIYSGLAAKDGNDLHPLSAIIKIESQSSDQRTRVLEFHKPWKKYNEMMDNCTIALFLSLSSQKDSGIKSPFLELFHAYL